MIKTIAEWTEEILPSEYQALEDMGYRNPQEKMTANEVLEAIVSWNGGIATAYHIRSIISRVYGIELE